VIDPRTQSWLDQEDASLAQTIRRCGWCVQYVIGSTCADPACGCGSNADDDPALAYTIGLFGMDHPELLILGMPSETAFGVLNHLGERVRGGAALVPGQPLTFPAWPHRIIPEEVPNPGEILLVANRFYKRPAEFSVPALQLSYDDLQGRFPWEPEYSEPSRQPRPGTFWA